MKAFLIDPEQKTITEVAIESKLESYYKAMGCSMIQFVSLSDDLHDLILDEEGAYSEEHHVFVHADWLHSPFIGKALLVGINHKDGKTVDAKIDLLSVKKSVYWADDFILESAASYEGLL